MASVTAGYDPFATSGAWRRSRAKIGVYIVLRRMVFVSAALSQAAGLGVAFAFYAQIALGATGLAGSPFACAMVFTFLAMALLVREGAERWISRESVLGAVYVVGGAGALLVGTKIQQEAHDIQAILFGTAVLVKPEDVGKLELIGGAILLLQLVLGRGLRFASFDRERTLPARNQGLRVYHRVQHHVGPDELGRAIGHRGLRQHRRLAREPARPA